MAVRIQPASSSDSGSRTLVPRKGDRVWWFAPAAADAVAVHRAALAAVAVAAVSAAAACDGSDAREGEGGAQAKRAVIAFVRDADTTRQSV